MIHVCAAVINIDGKYLFTSRPLGKHLAGQWEFPGGKVNINESAHDCLVRELHEELGVDIVPLERIYSINYEYPGEKVFLEFFKAAPVNVMNFNPVPREGQEVRWEGPNKLCDIDWVPADLPLVKYLVKASHQHALKPFSID
jgi:8-oxo-dGTP diphosphatase